MPHLLHIDASARPRSFSRELSTRFATSWRAAHRRDSYTYRDLAVDPAPPLSAAWTEICDQVLRLEITDTARYPEAVRTTEQEAAWQLVAPLLDELVRADVVLIGAPMYNFSVPAALKAWIDQVTFPRMNLAGKRFVVAGARGGSYLPGTPRAPFDHHETFLRDFISGHFAVDDVTFIHAELTNTLVDPVIAGLSAKQAESHKAALERVDTVATAFAEQAQKPAQ